MTATDPFGFADEMRLGLRGMVRRVWGKRGVKVRRRLQLSYQWRYLFMVVDGRAGRLYWCWHESMAATELLGMVRAVQQQSDLTALVWDGAPSHREERVQALGLPLISLPPYSPELNPAERFFQEVRRAVEGEPYATLEEKVAAVQAVLEEWDADPDRLRSLCGWQWIEDAAQTLPRSSRYCGMIRRDWYYSSSSKEAIASPPCSSEDSISPDTVWIANLIRITLAANNIDMRLLSHTFRFGEPRSFVTDIACTKTTGAFTFLSSIVRTRRPIAGSSKRPQAQLNPQQVATTTNQSLH